MQTALCQRQLHSQHWKSNPEGRTQRIELPANDRREIKELREINDKSGIPQRVAQLRKMYKNGEDPQPPIISRNNVETDWDSPTLLVACLCGCHGERPAEQNTSGPPLANFQKNTTGANRNFRSYKKRSQPNSIQSGKESLDVYLQNIVNLM